MGRDSYYERKVKEYDRIERRKERQEKWKAREKSFFKAFLFTENGKPKSSLLIYTFCLSLLFLAIYGVALFTLIDWLEPLVHSWPPVVGNLLITLLASVIGILIGVILHTLFPDKRLLFGAHVWLALYALAALVTVLIFLRGDAGLGDFLVFFGWFFLPPVLLGGLVFWALFRRDYEPEVKPEALQPWQKYTRR